MKIKKNLFREHNTKYNIKKKGLVLAIGLILLLSTFAVGTEIIYAQGDSFDDAEEITVPGQWSGTLDSDNEKDFYKFTLQPSEIITIEFSSNAASAQRLTFHNPNRQEMFRLDSSNTVIATDDYGLAYETDEAYWFIRIERRFSGSDGAYNFIVDIDTQDDAGSGSDAPSTFDEAYEIQEGEHTGMLKDLDEKDVYKIELEPSSIIEVELRSQANRDQTLKFYNPNREELFLFHSSGGSAYRNHYMLAYETEIDYWFIIVEKRYSDSDGQYTLKVTVDTQDDAGSGGDAPGTFDDALEIQEGEYEGRLGNLDRADMYKIYVESGSLIELEFSSESPSVFYDQHQLTLYNPDRTNVLSITSSEGSINRDEHTVTYEMESDYRYLKVDSIYSILGIHSPAEYRFVVSIEPLDTGFIPENYELDVNPISGESPIFVTISVGVDNVGDESGEVPVTINGEVVSRINVDPYSSASHTFNYLFRNAGEYTVVFGDKTVLVTLTEGDVEEPDNPYSDVVTDQEGDVIRFVGPEDEDWAYVDSPNVDILRVELSESGGVVTVSLTVKGTITDHPDIYYQIFLKDDTLTSFFEINYNNGEAWMSVYTGTFGSNFEPATTGAGTDTLSFDFTREQIGNPDILEISWATAINEVYPEADVAGHDAEYPPGYEDPSDDNGDPVDDNGDFYDDNGDGETGNGVENGNGDNGNGDIGNGENGEENGNGEEDDEKGFLSGYWWIIPIIVIGSVVGLVLILKMGKKGEPIQPRPEVQQQTYEEPPQDIPPPPPAKE